MTVYSSHYGKLHEFIGVVMSTDYNTYLTDNALRQIHSLVEQQGSAII